MADYEGAKTMLVGVQLTLLALFLPEWCPARSQSSWWCSARRSYLADMRSTD